MKFWGFDIRVVLGPKDVISISPFIFLYGGGTPNIAHWTGLIHFRLLIVSCNDHVTEFIPALPHRSPMRGKNVNYSTTYYTYITPLTHFIIQPIESEGKNKRTKPLLL